MKDRRHTALLWGLILVAQVALSLGTQPAPEVAEPLAEAMGGEAEAESALDIPALAAADTSADSTAQATPDTINYSAEMVDFDVPEQVIQLRRQADLRYGQYRLRADSVQVETARSLLTATGEAVLEDAEGLLIGDHVVLDLESERGRVSQGITAMEDGIYSGAEIRRVGRNHLDVDAGSFTTCRLEEPHFAFVSKHTRIEEDELAVARPVVVEVAEIPVFYFPYFAISLRRGRHSGLLTPSLEKDSVAGRYFRDLGYYWAPNDYLDLLASGDAYRTGRYRVAAEARFAKRYQMPASSLRWIETRDPDLGRNSRDLHLNHAQNFDNGARLNLTSNLRSSSRETSQQRSWTGNLNLSRAFSGWGQASLGLRSTRDFETDRIVETLPTVSFRSEWMPFFPAAEAADGPWASAEDSLSAQEGPAWYRSFGASYSVTAAKERNFNAGSAVGHAAIDHRLSLSARGLRFFDAISFAPNLTLQESWFDRSRDRIADRIDVGWRARHTWQADASLSTMVEGIYRPRWGRLSGVRHSVEPRLSFFYTPDFDQYFQEVGGSTLDIFSGLGSSSTPGERRSLSYSLGNRFEIKWWDQEEGREDRISLLNLQASGTYDDLRDVRSDLPGEQHFSNLSLSGRLTPSPDLGARVSLPYDPYERERGTMTWTLDASRRGGEQLREVAEEEPEAEPLSERQKLFANDPYAELSVSPWVASLRSTWTIPKEGDSTWRANGSLGFSPTPKWRIDYRTSYNFSDGERESQFLTVRRDLHCWTASFSWSESSGVWSYHILVRLKDLPDVKFEDREYGSSYR